MSDHKQPPPQLHSSSSNPPLRGAPLLESTPKSALSLVAGPIHGGTQEQKELSMPDSRDQGGQEAAQRIEDKKHRQEEKREEVEKEKEGMRQAASRTNNKPAPAAGGVGGPMGTEEGRKEDRLKGKL